MPVNQWEVNGHFYEPPGLGRDSDKYTPDAMNRSRPSGHVSNDLSVGLQVRVAPTQWNRNGTLYSFPGGTIVVPDGATSFIYLDGAEANGSLIQLKQQPASFPAAGANGVVWLAFVTSAGGVVIDPSGIVNVLKTVNPSAGGGGAPTGPAGGDLSGTYPNPSVAQVGGQAAATVAAHVAPAAGNPHSVTAAQVAALALTEVVTTGGAPGANKVPRADGAGKIDASWLPSTSGEGSPGAGIEHHFGEGPPTQAGLSCLRNDNLEVGVWTDDTAVLTGAGSAPLVVENANNTRYFGGDHRFTGLEVSCIAPVLTDAGNANLIWEYWNQLTATWQTLAIMGTIVPTALNDDRLSTANSVAFSVRTEQWRFDVPAAGLFPGWDKKTLNGINKYWIRVRVSGAAIPEGGTIDQVTLIQPTTVIRAKGTIEYFAHTPPCEVMECEPPNKGDNLNFGTGPANLDIPWTSEINQQRQDNRFNDGVQRRRTYLCRIPKWLDTSKKVICTLTFHPVDAQLGNINWVLRSSKAPVLIQGDVPTELKIYSSIFAVNGNPSPRYTVIFAIDLRSYRPFESTSTTGDILLLDLERDAQVSNLNDTYPNNVSVDHFEVVGKRWK